MMYRVTITPKVIMYSGSYVGGEYSVDVYAKDSKDAVSKARRQRTDQEGRMAGTATFKATRVED
jgi:hypothetical protein